MYNLYIDEEEMKGNTIVAQHTGVGEEDKQYTMPYMLIVYAAHGSGVHHIGNKRVEFNEGDVALIRANVQNCFYTKEKVFGELGGISMYICAFTEKAFSTAITGLRKEFKELKPFFDGEVPCIYVHDTEKKDLRNYFVKILDEVTYSNQGYKEKISSIMKLFLIDLFRLHAMGYMGENHLYSNRIVGELVNYVNLNIYRRLSLKSVAEMMHITPEYLCRIFKKYMNTTFTDYVNHKRVELIKDELEHTDRPIYLIYDDFEFTGAYLNELFKKYTGYSMTEYKNEFNYKKNNPFYVIQK